MKILLTIPKEYEEDARKGFYVSLERALFEIQFETRVTKKHDVQLLEFLRKAFIEAEYFNEV